MDAVPLTALHTARNGLLNGAAEPPPRTLVFTNPATGEQFGQVTMHTPDDVARATEEMRRAAKIWAQTPVRERVRILRKFQQVVVDALDEITDVMNQDCGKSRQDALVETFVFLEMLDAYCKHGPRWLRPIRVSSGIQFLKKSSVEYHPYGVVAIIAPWNYPLTLSLPPAVGALLAGNTVVLKPSEVTGATGVLIERLFSRVPELSPFIRVLHGDGQVGAAMVQSQPDYVFLTGSTATGRKVMKSAAEHLIPVACEMGGKDPMIVLEDADLRAAAHWGAWGSYFNAGQSCVAIERVYVIDQVYDEFVRMAVEETHKLRMGYTRNTISPYYLGPITDPRQIQIIKRHLDDAVARGARILTGGTIDGMFVEPTVLVDVTHEMEIMREESFGPLMPIMRVRNEDEAIRMANDNHLGLGASIWSSDIERAQRVAHRVEAASIIVNDTIAQFAVALVPFGGIKQSGYGRIHGREGLMQFTRPYSYVVGDPPPPYDVTVFIRRPGLYNLIRIGTQVLFGVGLRQRLRGLGPVLPVLGALAGVAGALFGMRKRPG